MLQGKAQADQIGDRQLGRRQLGRRQQWQLRLISGVDRERLLPLSVRRNRRRSLHQFFAIANAIANSSGGGR